MSLAANEFVLWLVLGVAAVDVAAPAAAAAGDVVAVTVAAVF